MKPLTIEQLKSLEVGDWVWVIDLQENEREYGKIFSSDTVKISYFGSLYKIALYSDYGTKWLAYKNKEQEECKGEIVELPCIREVKGLNYVRYNIYFIRTTAPDIGAIDFYTVKDKPEAERRLAELKGEV